MRDTRTGMTLAELLVALFVSAMIMTMLAIALGGFSRQSRSMASHRQDIEDRDDLIRAMRLSLRSALPLIRQDKEKKKDEALFSGTSASMRLLIRQDRWPTPPGLYELTFAVNEIGPGHWQVKLFRQPLDQLADFDRRKPRGVPAIIYNGAAKPAFAYAGIGKPQDKWQLAPRPPRNVILMLDDKPQVQLPVPPGLPLPGHDGKPGGTNGKPPDAPAGGSNAK